MPISSGRIRVGIGGWSYEPWRATFYPEGTPKTGELHYASRHVTSIEINSTFYRLQNPAVFAKWRDATPGDFMFAIKAPRFIVEAKDLAGTGASVTRFMSSGITALESKLGPVLWQLSPTKRFNADELGGFLSLLPARAGKLPMRHALGVRHTSFLTPGFLKIARRHDVAVVFEDDAVHESRADLTSSFVYARLRRCSASVATGYSIAALKQWARRAQIWAQGKEPKDLERIAPIAAAPPLRRDVFVYFINGDKERAPAAAQKLLSLLKSG
jgi:uncharacterized protein YecE (DUF72 family)